MRTTKTVVVVTLAMAAGLAATAQAGAPLGPPTALLGEGNWGIGAEYGHEQISMEACGTVIEVFPDDSYFFWTQAFEIEDLQTNMIFGTLAYGVCDTWDIFVRAGTADAKDDIVALPADAGSVARRDAFDGNFGLAWGAGTRATFCRSGPWSFGGTVQVTWFQPGDSDFTIDDPLLPDETWVGDIELDYWQAQVSLAASLQLDTLQFWIGPFLQFIDGDMDFDGQAVLAGGGTVSDLCWSSDLNESSQIGGFIGLNWEVTRQWNLWVEGQVTSDSWLVGVGTVIVPGRSAFDM